MERGERIELLVDKTEVLSASAVQFKKKSTELKNAMWWKNVKLYIIIGIVAVVLISSLLFIQRLFNVF